MALVELKLSSIPGKSRLAEVLLHAPKGNTLSVSVLDELIDVLQQIHTQEFGCLTISGGNHVFSVGADIDQLLEPEIGEVLLERLSKAISLITTFEGISIAAISGFALGGGAELALACDYIAGNDNSRIGFPEVSLGVIPGGGATQLLPNRIGVAKSIELILTGRIVAGQEAARMNLIDVCIGSEALSGWSLAFAEQIVSSNIDQIRYIKKLTSATVNVDNTELLRERIALLRLTKTLSKLDKSHLIKD